MAIMEKETWERHSNPWSVWTRILTNPLAYVPVWNRSWRQAIPVALWFWLNPRLFPPPEDDSSCATRGVLGEQLWTASQREKLSPDFPMILNAMSALFAIPAVHAAYNRRLGRTLPLGGFALTFKMWFVDRMVARYEAHLRESARNQDEDRQTQKHEDREEDR